MEILKDCLPEIRYFLSLSKLQKKKFLNKASPQFIQCLHEVAINLLYAHKDMNGLTLDTSHIKSLKKHRSTLLRLVKAKRPAHHRKLLKIGGSATVLLSILGAVIASLAALL